MMLSAVLAAAALATTPTAPPPIIDPGHITFTVSLAEAQIIFDGLGEVKEKEGGPVKADLLRQVSAWRTQIEAQNRAELLKQATAAPAKK